MSGDRAHGSVLLAAMADGIGDLAFGTAAWIDAAREALSEAARRHAEGLRELPRFTLCEVAHNAPPHLRGGSTLAWHATLDGGRVEAAAGELPEAECDFKIEADHSILSNLARIQYSGRDPEIVAAARQRLSRLTRWVMHGRVPEHGALGAVLRSLHDALAVRTLPRFVWMSPEWVSCARHVLTTRATSEKYADGIRDLQYTFAEEFTETPRYAFPDGANGGFWVRCDHGEITVGAGPLPAALQPADRLTFGVYAPVVTVGRTVNAALSEADQQEIAEYSKTAFRFDKTTMRRAAETTFPSGRGEMPPELSRIFMPLHDELGKRTSGERPSDYDPGIRPEWAVPLGFDRDPGYDPSWLRYDRVDVYGDPIG